MPPMSMLPVEVVKLVARISLRPSTYMNIRGCSRDMLATLEPVTRSYCDDTTTYNSLEIFGTDRFHKLTLARVEVCGAIWSVSCQSSKEIVFEGGGKCAQTCKLAVPNAKFIVGSLPVIGDADIIDIVGEVFGKWMRVFCVASCGIWRLNRIPRRHIIPMSEYISGWTAEFAAQFAEVVDGVEYNVIVKRSAIECWGAGGKYIGIWPSSAAAYNGFSVVFLEGAIAICSKSPEKILPILSHFNAALLERLFFARGGKN